MSPKTSYYGINLFITLEYTMRCRSNDDDNNLFLQTRARIMYV